MKFLLIAELLLATCYVIEANVYVGKTTVSQSGLCVFDKYNGGDNDGRTIRKIPTKAAAIPGSVLREMFGKSANKIVNRLDLGANGAMHFINAAKGFTGTFSKIAPKLAPCLGLLGVGFGFIARELTTVDPADIIKNVNKAIKEVVDETNQRFREFKQYVDGEFRNSLKISWDADYRGQFEVWNRCLDSVSKEEADTCQKNVAQTINGLKYHFMNVAKFESNPNGIIEPKDIKLLELQLPLTKRFADLHLLVIGALIKMYEEEDTPLSKKSYQRYRIEFLEEGRRYVSYMEWVMKRIRQSRIDEQKGAFNLTCGDYEDDIEAKMTFPTSRGIGTSKVKCDFQITQMRVDKCTLDALYDCDDGDCYVCSGWICRSWPGLHDQHAYFKSDVHDIAKRLRDEYLSKLTSRLDTFWEVEVGLYLPAMKEIFEELKLEKREEGESNGRDEVSKKEPEDLSEEEKEINEEIDESAKERKEMDDQVLEGTDGKMSFADYFKLVAQNTEKIKKKMKRRNRKMNIKSKRNKKTDQ